VLQAASADRRRWGKTEAIAQDVARWSGVWPMLYWSDKA